MEGVVDDKKIEMRGSSSTAPLWGNGPSSQVVDLIDMWIVWGVGWGGTRLSVNYVVNDVVRAGYSHGHEEDKRTYPREFTELSTCVGDVVMRGQEPRERRANCAIA
jgi:hypothetical protein